MSLANEAPRLTHSTVYKRQPRRRPAIASVGSASSDASRPRPRQRFYALPCSHTSSQTHGQLHRLLHIAPSVVKEMKLSLGLASGSGPSADPQPCPRCVPLWPDEVGLQQQPLHCSRNIPHCRLGSMRLPLPTRGLFPLGLDRGRPVGLAPAAATLATAAAPCRDHSATLSAAAVPRTLAARDPPAAARRARAVAACSRPPTLPSAVCLRPCCEPSYHVLQGDGPAGLIQDSVPCGDVEPHPRLQTHCCFRCPAAASRASLA